MPEPCWLPLSIIPLEWRNQFIILARQGQIRTRARQHLKFQVADEDLASLGSKYHELVISRQKGGCHLTRSVMSFDEWARPFVRQFRLITKTKTDFEFSDDRMTDGILSRVDWNTSSVSSFHGDVNIDHQQPGYMLIGIEFDGEAARRLGCHLQDLKRQHLQLCGASDQAGTNEIANWIRSWLDGRSTLSRDDAWRDFRAVFEKRSVKQEVFRSVWSDVRQARPGRPKRHS